MTDYASLPDHIRRPDLRPVQPIPVNKDGQRLFALRDPVMVNQQTMVVPPQALTVLQQFRGERPIEEIAEQFNGSVDQFIELAQGLDKVGLLWGPTFKRLEEELKAEIRAAGVFPPGAAQSMGEDEASCRQRIEGYFDQTEDPELDGPATGIVAPHLDYERGWPNYAAAYYMLRNTPSPDRVVILATNHFGLGDGVVATEFGFSSPMGQCPIDTEVIPALLDRLGPNLTIDQLDHLGEHSVQLHLPWIQYCFGEVPIVAVLIPDPLTPMVKDDDDERIDSERFAEALGDVLGEKGGQTLFVASSDLSHVGPQFGEPRPVDDQRRMDVEQHDRDMLAKFITGEADEFLSAMRWNRNPTRWCSIGNMATMLQIAGPETIELIDYRQAWDEKGAALVSSAAIVLQ